MCMRCIYLDCADYDFKIKQCAYVLICILLIHIHFFCKYVQLPFYILPATKIWKSPINMCQAFLKCRNFSLPKIFKNRLWVIQETTWTAKVCINLHKMAFFYKWQFLCKISILFFIFYFLYFFLPIPSWKLNLNVRHTYLYPICSLPNYILHYFACVYISLAK